MKARNNNWTLVILAVAFAPLLLSACSNSQQEEANGGQASSVAGQQMDRKESKDQKIVASVDSQPIYQADLERAKARWVGKAKAKVADERMDATILDRLIRSRAMALAMEAQLSPAELEALTVEVASFREDLLVRKYIEKHSQETVITPEQIREFYQQNLQIFGGGEQKEVELVTVDQSAATEEKAKLLTALDGLKDTSDWRKGVAELTEQGFKLSYKHSTVTPDLLRSPLRELVKNSSKEEGAKLVTTQPITLIRVLSVKTVPAKPLSQVTEKIRKTLQTQAMRDRVEALSNEVMAKVTVEKP